MRVLRRGLSGPDVKQWQEFLSRQGFGVGTADGSFGERTFQATVEFQRRNGLGSDGVVGPGTLGKAKELGFVEDQDAGGAPAGGPTGASSSLSEQALAQIMPNLGAQKRAAFFPFLTSAMAEFEINTPARQAAFLAQLAHESAEFRFMEEIWGPTPAQRRYEGRRDLGNTQPGDGFRFKGRGPIQVTGRANYKRYGDLLGIDLVGNPQLAATPEVGFRIAGLYWRTNGINAMADRQDIVAVTRAINGGTNGLDDRRRYYDRARRVLGVSSGTRGLGGGTTRGLGDEVPARVLTRGLDEAGETTPTAAERNAPETSTTAETPAAGEASASGAAKKGGAKAAAKKAAKGAAKKSAKKSAAKKSGAKKSAAKKSTAKKAAAKKSGAKKAAAKKSPAKKSAAKKVSSKKSAAKKGAKGAAAKKGPGASKKSSGKGGSKKGGSKKSASKKGASKKSGKGGAGRRGGR